MGKIEELRHSPLRIAGPWCSVDFDCKTLGKSPGTSSGIDIVPNHSLVQQDRKQSRILWQREPDGLYGLQLQYMNSCKFRGHDVYLVFGQEGAAWQTVQPIYIENGAGHSLPTSEEEVFEICEFPDKTQRLVGFQRIFSREC